VKRRDGTAGENTHFPFMGWFRAGSLFLTIYTIAAVFPALPAGAGDPVLPGKAPRPPRASRDAQQAKGQPVPPAVAPVPVQRPQTMEDAGKAVPHPTESPQERQPSTEAPKSGEKPVPSAKEAAGRLEEKPKRERPSPPPPPAQLACQADLKKLGVRFGEKAPVSDPLGCAIANPLEVTWLSGSVTIKPAATMNCAVSDALSRFVTWVVSPEARKVFGSPLAGVVQASAYVCRDRHGTEKISEHAFGNAIDIARFLLKDGTVIDVKDYAESDPKRSQFLAYVRKAACGPFRTVLGPGADADHSLHFHFDLEPRHSLHPFCQ
jgi:hypothetical protein